MAKQQHPSRSTIDRTTKQIAALNAMTQPYLQRIVHQALLKACKPNNHLLMNHNAYNILYTRVFLCIYTTYKWVVLRSSSLLLVLVRIRSANIMRCRRKYHLVYLCRWCSSLHLLLDVPSILPTFENVLLSFLNYITVQHVRLCVKVCASARVCNRKRNRN